MKMFKRSLVASSIIASLCITSTSYADDIEVKISNSLLDTYTDKYEEADLVVMKLSDIRLSAMAYWAQNESYPSVINDLVADSFYFGTFTTTFGSVINGANNVDSYALTIDLPSPELASYVASSVNGTFTGNTVRLEFGLPMSAIARDVSLSRFDDPANPDLNRMEADIDMNGNNIDNVGALTANNATINGDLVVNSGTNTLEMTASGLSYNGSEVITSDNIGAYSAGADAVLKSEDAIMNGAYTIQGVGSSINMADDSRLNFVNGAGISGNFSVQNGQSEDVISIDDDTTSLGFAAPFGRNYTYLRGNDYARQAELSFTSNVYLNMKDTDINIGGRKINTDYAARVNLFSREAGGEISMYVGWDGHTNPSRALLAANDVNDNAYVSLMYRSDPRLTTNADGVNVNGAITSNNVTISDTQFVYQGNDVLTSGNFMTYAADASDAVSKTQDGTLRGLYTIDGSEDDGTTPSGAGFNFINGADLNMASNSAINLFQNSGNTTRRVINIGGTESNPAAFLLHKQTGSFSNIHETWFQSGHASNNNYTIGLKSTQLGSNITLLNDSNSDDGGIQIISSRAPVTIQAGASHQRKTLLRTGFADNRRNISLLNDGSTRYRTATDGSEFFGNISARALGQSSNYLEVSDSSFTYNGADVITAANIGSYAATAEDAVSKTQDGTLRGIYTIDGLEDDGVTPSNAGLNFVNGAGILQNGRQAITLNPITTWGQGRTQVNVDGHFSVSSPRSQNFFSVGDGYASGLYYRPTGEGDTSVDIRSTTNNWGGQTYGQLSLGANAVLKHNGGNVFIGASDDRFKAFGGGSQNVRLFADKEITLSLSHAPDPSSVNGSRTGILVARNSDDLKVYSAMNYHGYERLRTTSTGVQLTGDLTSRVNNGDGTFTDILNLSDSAFTYKGDDVITAANIATYTGGVTDAVSKSQDGTLRGLYTIDGLEDDGVTNSNAGIKVVNNGYLQFGEGANTFRLSPHLDGLKARTNSHDFFFVNQGDFHFNSRRNGSISFNAYRFNSGVREGLGKVFVNNEGLELLSDDPRFYSGVRAFRGQLTLRASNQLNLGFQDGGNVGVLGHGLSGTNDFIRATKDNGNAQVSLLYANDDRLTTTSDGVLITGDLNTRKDNGDGTFSDVLNLSDSVFTYNGADVITAANIATYTGGATDAVSKSQDGTLRGLYTIDGLEDDGVTPSGAGLNFVNGAIITGDINVVDGNTPYFVVNKSGQGKNGVGLRYQPTGPNTDVILSGKSETGTAELILDGYARLRSINGGDVFIGVADERIESFGGASGKVFVGARNNVSLAVGNASGLEPGIFLEGKNDGNNNAFVSLKYDSETRLNTNSNGIDIAGNLVAAYDSNADGIPDTEYLSVDETAFTYNGADVITAANIATYTGGVTDAVSKSQDGTLRGLYTIDGLEDDGVTRSFAGFNLINGAPLIVQSGPSIFGVGNGSLQATQFFLRLETEGGLVALTSSAANLKGTRTFVTGEDELTLGLADSIGVVGENFLTMSSDGAFLNNSEGVFLRTDTAQLSMGPAQTILRANDSVIVSSDNDIALGLGNLDGTSVAIGSDFLRVRPEVFEISHNSLLQISSPDLVVVDPSDEANPVLNVNKTTFTYNGAEVVTADNLNAYIDTSGLVSKSEDGILRGMYTFDGLEEDGVTPSNAGLNFVNGMKIQVNGNDRIFTSNNNRNLNISTIENLEANAAVIRLLASKTGNTSSVSLSDINFVLKSRDIHLGGFGSQETRADLINLSSGEDIVLRTGPLASNTEIVFLGKFDASTGESYSQMLYESVPRITTTSNGVEINGAVSALFDSDADGIGDTEYLNIERDVNNTVSLTAFSDKFEALTYNSDTKIWATNAELSASEISTTTLSAQFITADDVTVNTRLTVEGIDVGQWIKDCEAGISTGCTM